MTSVPRLYYYAPLVGLTAWQAIVEVMHLRPGQKLLVHAGSGGVGTFAIQLARHKGLHVATTVSAASAGRAKDLGAAEIVDYRSGRFEDVLTGFDAVFDTLGMNLEGSFRVLKPGGIVVSVAAIPTAGTARELGRPWWVRGLLNIATRKIRHLAISQGKRYRFLFVRPSGETLATIASLVEAGTIRPVIDRVFPFAETKEALAYVESGRAKGKVVIKVR